MQTLINDTSELTPRPGPPDTRLARTALCSDVPYPADFPTSKRIEGQLRAVVFTDHSESGTSVRATHTYVVLDGRGARGWWSPAGQRARGCSSYDRRGALRQRTPGPTRGG